ncbi:biotin/lipoate A/B protein ligase family protein [Tersicoccus sp. MR15.9]|uniref:lipoate--protein ligase family protein n=1 Tax=Tersicoccus mangrovi TaxID=3121635 RepID=UPI002FE63389
MTGQTPAVQHGEYKVPGGKLVVVDLRVDDGRLADVSISGDFFLEPDDFLPVLNGALDGLDANAAPSALTAALDAVVTEDTRLHGFSTAAITVAVRRALGKATGWTDHEWEIITDAAFTTLMHVSLDEVLTEEVGNGTRRPTLRFWELADSPNVYIGSFQSLRNEVDPEGARETGAHVVRRITGGGAMFTEHGNAITYSIYVPQTLVDGLSYTDSYAFLDSWVMASLEKIGVTAFYQPINDIATPEGKIGGAAQKRLANGGLLHHVTMSYDVDADKMVKVLRIGKEKMSDKGTRSAKKRVDPLRRQTGMTREAIIDVMAQTFIERTGAVHGEVTEAELAEAQRRIDTKFGTEEWLTRVP